MHLGGQVVAVTPARRIGRSARRTLTACADGGRLRCTSVNPAHAAITVSTPGTGIPPRLERSDPDSPGFLASFFLHIPLGVTYIRALKAAEGLTRGDFMKSAAYTVAFAVIGVAGPNVVGKNKNTPYCGPRNRRDRTMLNQPDARARCGGGRRQCDAAGHAGGKRVTQSGFEFAGPRP